MFKLISSAEANATAKMFIALHDPTLQFAIPVKDIRMSIGDLLGWMADYHALTDRAVWIDGDRAAVVNYHEEKH